MPTDALIVSVASYPFGNRLLDDLPGAKRDRVRMRNWLQLSEEDVEVEDFSWPTDPAPAEPKPWNGKHIEAAMQQLLKAGLRKTRKRLFFYASAHGMAVPASPALPAVYCAAHEFSVPDLFLSSGWIPQFTAAPLYDEYLCFFDCCNDRQPGTLPVFQPQNLSIRSEPPRVLVVAACKPGQQALETENGGIFTDVLLEALSGSAGTPGSASVTAADVLAYLTENVPIRADQAEKGRVQTPIAWVDPNSHVELAQFVLFDRRTQEGVDVAPMLLGQDAAHIHVQGSDLMPVGQVQVRPDGAALLPALFPGKYVLHCKETGWKQAIRLKTTVADNGSVSAKVEIM